MLDVLFCGLKASPVAWTSLLRPGDKSIAIFKKSAFFVQFFVIRTLNPYPGSIKMPDPNPDLMNPDPQHFL